MDRIENGYGYSLQDMCDIANFDFFSNPFIPGQPLDYYSKFLKPLHDVLASYKKFWTNAFIGQRQTYSKCIDGINLPVRHINGKDRRIART